MGVCASCLGASRNGDGSEEDESSRLLFDDSHPNQYGSFSDQNAALIQADPQELQKETEALQKVVTQTSNHLVDIFAMVTQNVPRGSTATFSGQDARLLRYQNVLTKMATNDQSHTPMRQSTESTSSMCDGWISEDDDVEEIKSYGPVKSTDVGPLLGGFADAESAME